MNKLRLLTPGPTSVPAEALLEMARPVEHHRTPEFRAMFKQVTEDLQYVFQTANTVLTVTGSGTSAMESAIVGTCPPGSKALVVRGGKFGERWAEICAAFDIDHVACDVEWGHGAKPEMIEDCLSKDPSITTVIVTHSETSTAAVSDLEGIARVVRQRGDDILLIVDGITSVGAIPVRTDQWGVDVVVTGSQKALMLPPGLACLAVGDRAWKRVDSFSSRSFYLCPKAYRKSMADFDTPYTPNNVMIRGLAVTLKMIRDEGIENVWARTALLARATRAAAEAIGIKVYAADPSDSVSALCMPEGIDESKLRKTVRQRYGVHLAGGQGKLKGNVIRISHMGYVDALDTIGAISAIEMVLSEMGHDLKLGSGAAAAMTVIARRS
ncbi:MAG: alanine--glyoxylate aminotransferase family protein [Phycisphaerae bacterium]|nr:alanine--glyoxylate aminotransferase family protein [Phycisphaerae bacterium]